MILMGDRVPMFKLRPYRGLLIVAFFVLVVVAFSRYGFRHLWHHRPGYKRG